MKMDEPNPATDPRVLLAAERTYLAWLRTGIALMGFGFVVARFSVLLAELATLNTAAHPPGSSNPAVGVFVVATGVLVNLWASLRHRRMLRVLRSGSTDLGLQAPLAVGVVTAVGGLVLMTVLLGAMVR
jgi:putative membrane protein